MGSLAARSSGSSWSVGNGRFIRKIPTIFLHFVVVIILGACQGYWGRTDSSAFHDEGRGLLTIHNATGGSIWVSRLNFDRLDARGVKIVVDGWCSSACTLLLDERYDDVCWTERALFRFHAASEGQAGPGAPRGFPKGTAYMWESYPPYVQALLPPQETWRVDRWLQLSARDLPDGRRCPVVPPASSEIGEALM